MLQIAEAIPAGNWPKPSEVLALEWFYMWFHKNDHNKFVTLGRKLDTKTFELVTEFFEAQFTMNKNTVRSNAWSSSILKNKLRSSSKISFAIRFTLVRTNVVPTRQNVRSTHVTPNAALTMIARSNIGTSTAIAIGIAPTTITIEQ